MYGSFKYSFLTATYTQTTWYAEVTLYLFIDFVVSNVQHW
jgi:hypothetical protein